MQFFIVRISETSDRTKHERLPGYYGDGHALDEGLKKVLAAYPASGRNEEHGYSWARDAGGNEFKFTTGNT